MKNKTKITTEESKQKSLELAQDLALLLEAKKASNIVLMDLKYANPYFCYFLIASANSPVQLKSLVRDLMKSFGSDLPSKYALRPEDLDSGWVVLDFIDVVVHIFTEEERDFYNLERLWGDAETIELTK